MTIERVTSPGGIEAWLIEDHTLPVVSIRFAFPAALRSTRPARAGSLQ
jgi:zinc protease